MQLIADVDLHGGLVRRRTLLGLGHSPSAIRNAVAAGHLRVVARSWVASDRAMDAAVRAVRARGVLGGASALHSLGVWVTERPRTATIATPHSASRLPPLAPGDRRIYCRSLHVDPYAPWRVSVADALRQALPHMADDDAVATLDSVLQLRLLTRAELREAVAALPRRVRRLWRSIDGRAESGIETKLRLALLREGLRVEVQVRIDGVGRVDLVIDGWLVVEADGAEYHDSPEQARADRLRNAALVRRGYRWHRFGYDQVMFDLDGCVAVVLELLRHHPARRRAS
ncbi:endonuclease domain-containing protein [Agromyces archimandritae]|uniref:DUF559 domain-containing protein n=1 Tax=Agromyces archimandritae TaxID=2781962 RepID=A0A975FNR3_9MICO|nr:DUF559 domain-containing protein [Agromyces archimandritae]QTX05560.1 DUF559 domain-containing protein [Agromyces archimandritae]